MAWIGKDDALVGVDSAGTREQLFCAVSKKYRLVLGIENDAAVSFIHDFKDLLNKHIVDGKLSITSGDATNPSDISVIDKILSFVASDLGHENTHINLEITPVISINSSEGDKHPFARAFANGLLQRKHVLIRDAKSELNKLTES